LLYLQLIRTEWTEKSRGGAQAALRNNTPMSLPIEMVDDGKAFAIQFVSCEESLDFLPASRLLRASVQLPSKWACAELAITEGQYRIGFVWDALECGAPKRPDRHLFSLQPGEVGRFRCNGRFADADTGNWFYQMSTYNFANIDRLDADMFINAALKKDISVLEALR